MTNGYMALFVFGILFALRMSAVYSRIAIGLFFVIDIVLITFLRTFRKYQIKVGYRSGKNVNNTIIITYKDRLLDSLEP